MKINMLMVVKNEANRYLQSVLEYHSPFFDNVIVVDDNSSDDTVKIALDYTSKVFSKPEAVPGFTEHEGRFREYAWTKLSPYTDEGDWVLVVDADEFFVSHGSLLELRDSLFMYVSHANALNRDVITMNVHEIWHHEMVPLKRVDGFWATNVCFRFVRYLGDMPFMNKTMGSHSVPQHYLNLPKTNVSLASMLHLGYLDDQDKEDKFNRYMAMQNHGHNQKHINSITQTAKLVELHGEIPKYWRGYRD